MNPVRPVFFVSDHTGITAEIIGKSLLSQYPDEAFATESLPFVDSQEKAQNAASHIREVWKQTSVRPIVFSSLTDPNARAALNASEALVMDIYGQFLGMMTAEIGHPATPARGKFHAMGDQSDYTSRIDALNFSLASDDGMDLKYDRADLILVGVSRSGKTPTSLYMAMQYGLCVSNYPLTPEHFERFDLPAVLKPHLQKLRGLTLSPQRLAQIRAERRPNSEYASMETCKQELAAAEKMMRSAGIPVLDSTTRSVEEIAALLRQSMTNPTVPRPA
jgi:[pyruvate, water dikinase]-phosphate phosphotransferase / [pyruvate, water dikinase] kinase